MTFLSITNDRHIRPAQRKDVVFPWYSNEAPWEARTHCVMDFRSKKAHWNAVVLKKIHVKPNLWQSFIRLSNAVLPLIFKRLLDLKKALNICLDFSSKFLHHCFARSYCILGLECEFTQLQYEIGKQNLWNYMTICSGNLQYCTMRVWSYFYSNFTLLSKTNAVTVSQSFHKTFIVSWVS